MRRAGTLVFGRRWLGLVPLALMLVTTPVFGGEPGRVTPPASPEKDGNEVLQRVVQNGLAVELRVTPFDETGDGHAPSAGRPAMVTLSLTDAKSGAPVTGVRPRAWMTSRPSEMVSDEVPCADKIRRLLGGRLGARADVDMNQYVVLSLNHDKTISVINPLVEFSPSKLESLVPLPGTGADWVLTADGTLLYVTMPDEAAVAVVDTRSRRLVATVSTGAGSRPGRIVLQPDGRQVWVGLDGTGQVAALDAATSGLAAVLSVGQGLHALAFTPDSRLLYVTNSQDNSVAVVDAQTNRVTNSIPVPDTPVALTYAGAAKRMYVASLNGSVVTVIDPARQSVSRNVAVRPGVVAVAVEPQGRFVFSANQMTSDVSIIDSATDTVVARVPVVKDPDQIVFTSHYAYVRGIESEKVSLIELGALRQGNATPVDLQIGRQAPSVAPQELGVSPMIAPTPDGNAVMVANAPDATLYYYQEGMMAPMGAFSNYRRMPRGIVMLDRSLKEVAPGTYRVPVTFPKGGRFDVPLLLEQPRLSHCFQVTVQESPGQTLSSASRRPPTVQALPGEVPVTAKQPTALLFKLLDPSTSLPIMGLTDVQVLLVEPPGVWQQRHWAKELEGGTYSVTSSFPHAGDFTVMVQAPSRHLRFTDGTPTVVAVGPAQSRSEVGTKAAGRH
ncbi:MAG: YncE family protein [Nitrospiraceae bacterium]|nr:YncE family protein [Nitrospiraceae bacterium]